MLKSKKQVVYELIAQRDMTTSEVIQATGYTSHSAAKLINALDDAGRICRVQILRREDQRGHLRQCVVYSIDMSRAQPDLRVEPPPPDSAYARKRARHAARLEEAEKRIDTGALVARAIKARRPLEIAWAGVAA